MSTMGMTANIEVRESDELNHNEVTAFDTIDHNILLSKLSRRYGVQGTAFKWFESDLSDRVQAVTIDEVESDLHHLIYGVQQGSVLGPILFILYTSPLGDLLRECGISFHLYADDMQLNISFKLFQTEMAKVKMEDCIEKVRIWMSHNFLKLNKEKTEFIMFGSPNLLSKKLMLHHLPYRQ